MNSPLIDNLLRLGIMELAVLVVTAVFLLWAALSQRVHILMFVLVASAAFVGTSIPVVSGLAAITRWASISLLLLSGLVLRRLSLSPGIILYWGYAFLGFASLMLAISFEWQFQKAALLLFVATALPLAFSGRPLCTYRKALVGIALAETLFAVVNIIPLFTQLDVPERFSGFCVSAPIFADVLGALFPFSYWALWNAPNRLTRALCMVGFFCAIFMLALSGQRAGTIEGAIGVTPLFFLTTNRRRGLAYSMLLLCLLSVAGLFVFRQVGTDKRDFISARYGPDADLSGRPLIWATALSEIYKSPFLGHGTGAAEQIIPSSFHNVYLEAWFNAGSLGLLLFVLSQAWFLNRAFRLSRPSHGREVRQLAALSLGYMLSFSALGLVESVGAGASTQSVILYLYLGTMMSSEAVVARKPEVLKARFVPVPLR